MAVSYAPQNGPTRRKTGHGTQLKRHGTRACFFLQFFFIETPAVFVRIGVISRVCAVTWVSYLLVSYDDFSLLPTLFGAGSSGQRERHLLLHCRQTLESIGP